METRGFLAPSSTAEATSQFQGLEPAARTVTREIAKAMGFDRAEFEERVTGDVVDTALDALFASLLEVHLGTREEYEEYLDDHPDRQVHLVGSQNVDRRAWHPAPAVEGVAAVTYQDEPDAAAATVRRQAFGRFYRTIVREG
ncbi:MAG: DUF5809 family protein [Halodesulfurarchaeum sp.]